MSKKQDECQCIQANPMSCQENFEINSKEKGDYYNLAVAAFTFGSPQAHKVNFIQPLEKETNEYENFESPYSRKNISAKMVSHTDTERFNEKNMSIKQPQENIFLTSFLNKLGSHHSFLSVVIHLIWNMKTLRNFLLNELIDINEADSNSKLLWELRSTLIKYSENKKTDLTKLRRVLANLFQNKRKFLLEQPDDPIDCYFTLINCIHSHYMKFPQNEVTDDSCNKKCFSHKNLWIDLLQLEECECKGASKRLFSNHHYIFDIPLDKVFDLCNNTNLVEMNKSFKLKSGKLSQVGSTETYSVADLKGKLFLYFKMLFNQIKRDCPINGTRCKFNNTQTVLYLTNYPNYLIFALQYGRLTHARPLLMEILKTFILIPKIFDLSTLFDHSSNEKVFFEYFGCIMIKPYKTYTCAFKFTVGNDCSWIYYDDETVINFHSYVDFISYVLKHGDMPIAIVYHAQEKYTDGDKDISAEELQSLERYAKSADEFSNSAQNSLRINEDIIKFDNTQISFQQSFENIPGGSMNVNLHPNQNPHMHNTSKTSTSISTSKNNSMHNSSNSLMNAEYFCIHCNYKNRIECTICSKCGNSNEDLIEEFAKRRHSAIQDIRDERESIPNKKNYSIKKGGHANPFVKADNKKDKAKEKEEYNNNISEEDIRSQEKYFNMPKQMIPKKEIPVIIKVDTNGVNYPGKNVVNSPEKRKHHVDEDMNWQNEDRILPLEMKRKNKNQMESPILTAPEVWSCQNCDTSNKAYEYKCKCCKAVNQYQRDIIDNIISNNHKLIDNSKESEFPVSNNSIKSPSTDERRIRHSTLDKKATTEKKMQLQPSESERNLYQNDHNNANSSNNIFKQKHSCICYTNYNESVIRNNICTICNRRVENCMSYENTIKMRYQQDFVRRQSGITRSTTPSNNKNNSNQSKTKKENTLPINNSSKFRCPPSSLQQTLPSNRQASINRNNNYIEKVEDEAECFTPYLQGGIRGSKVTQQEVNDIHNSNNAMQNQYKSNPSRMNSTTKKKGIELTIAQHAGNQPPKKRK